MITVQAETLHEVLAKLGRNYPEVDFSIKVNYVTQHFDKVAMNYKECEPHLEVKMHDRATGEVILYDTIEEALGVIHEQVDQEITRLIESYRQHQELRKLAEKHYKEREKLAKKQDKESSRLRK